MTTISQRIADLYDSTVPDWPGEIDFYRHLAGQAAAQNQSVLEVACGTGRIAVRLARDGARVVGLDITPQMLGVARAKSADLPNVAWVEGDMRSFDLGQTFGLIILPGHAFHNLTTMEDQKACLESIRRHLAPDGILVLHLDHQDPVWLGEIGGHKKGVLEPTDEVVDPNTGNPVRTSRAWAYERATQTAITWSLYEELDPAGNVIDRWQSGPWRLHCFFRFEVEHLLVRAGYEIEALYGDFSRQPLTDQSSEMVWLARAARA